MQNSVARAQNVRLFISLKNQNVTEDRIPSHTNSHHTEWQSLNSDKYYGVPLIPAFVQWDFLYWKITVKCVIVLSIVLLFPKKTRRAGLLSLLALLGSLCVTNFLLKNYVARVRPYEVVAGLQCLIAAQPDWSFPSGHASASFASAVVIYKSCPRGIGVPALILAFAISLSRLYVGVHYPSDVIVGMVIGTLIALILFWIFGEKKYKARARRR